MCLIIDKTLHGDSLKPAVADKDITVYKLLRVTKSLDGILIYLRDDFASPYVYEEVYETPFQNTRISFGYNNTYLLKADSFPNEHADSDEITHGVHAFQTLNKANEASLFRKSPNSESRVYAFRAVIPAGTPFYVGTDNDVVADELLIFKIMDSTDNGQYLIYDWRVEQNELHTKLKIALECIDNATEKLQDLRKKIAEAEAEEYKAKKAYDRGFEAGKKLSWKPTVDQVNALQLALVRYLGEGASTTTVNLQSLLYQLQELIINK